MSCGTALDSLDELDETTPLDERPLFSRRPSAEARYQLLAAAGVLSAVCDAAGRCTVEHDIAVWFAARARAAFRRATWADDARYGTAS